MVRHSEPAGVSSDTERAVAHVKDAIVNGRYVSGQRLIEADLAGETGLRRSPIREALRVLAGEGLVELLPNRGCRVRPFTRADFVYIMEILDAVEKIGIKKAANVVVGNESLQSTLRENFSSIEEAASRSTILQLLRAVEHYHDWLNALPANSHLLRMISVLYVKRYYRELAQVILIEDRDRIVNHYRSLTDALLRGDVACALRNHDEHMQFALELMQQSAAPPSQPPRNRHA